MKKLKLQPLANAKKLSRNELKNIFGGFGSGGDFVNGIDAPGDKCDIFCDYPSSVSITNCNGICSADTNWKTGKRTTLYCTGSNAVLTKSCF